MKRKSNQNVLLNENHNKICKKFMQNNLFKFKKN